MDKKPFSLLPKVILVLAGVVIAAWLAAALQGMYLD
jgi:hypothetical protein